MALGPGLQVGETDTLRPLHPLSLDQKLQLIRACLEDGQAEEILEINLRGKSTITDVMVIASGNSQRQLNALADRLDAALRPYGERLVMEGRQTSDWLLVDAGDVIVHLFRPEMRKFYNLEKMWGG
jgi:ribosome-associated protein